MFKTIFNNKFLVATTSYGFTRKILQLSNANYDGKDVEYPLLFTEKTAIALSSAIIAPSIFPLYIFWDLCYIETELFHKDKNIGRSFKDKKYYSSFDYILS